MVWRPRENVDGGVFSRGTCWKSCQQVPVRTLSMIATSRLTKTTRKTCFSAPVSEKKVLKWSGTSMLVGDHSPTRMVRAFDNDHGGEDQVWR